MKPRKVTRRVTVTAQDDPRDRLVVSVTVDDSPSYADPARHGGTKRSDSPVRAYVRRTRREGTKQRNAPP